eukprot:jgi/Chlat1/3692/Chrsp247S03836
MTVAVPAPWALPAEEVARQHGSSLVHGLTAEGVEEQRRTHGWNELTRPPPTPLWKLVLAQFDDLLVRILLGAAVVSFILAVIDDAHDGEGAEDVDGLFEYVEPLVIVLILIVNAMVGVWQESNAENALEALKEMQSETAHVVRGARTLTEIPARELVPGDLIELHAGDRVPADARVVSLRTATCRVDQSSLTGEAQAVQKSTAPVEAGADIQGKECMVFAGTAVANGSVRAIVTHTGMETEIGHVQSQIQAASLEDTDTPLKKKLDEFGKRLTWVIGVICALVWLINYRYFLFWPEGSWLPAVDFSKCTYYFKIAVALAVAAIPEGLPAVITTCLALGTRKMAQKNAIVRKLPSVETLGCTTVICSDKTGTLTTNQMAVVALAAPGTHAEELREFIVEGSTYDASQGRVVGLPPSLDYVLQGIAQVCALNNDAHVEFARGLFRASGMPTEAALKVLVEKLGVPDVSAQSAIGQARLRDPFAHPLGCCEFWSSQFKRVALLEFDRDRKSMGVVVTPATAGSMNGPMTRRRSMAAQPQNVLLVKGAPENLLERCSHIRLSDGSEVPLTDGTRTALLSCVERMSSRALRCLAFATKHSNLGDLADYDGTVTHPGHRLLLEPNNYRLIESNLTFVGVAGLQDPPRPEVAQSIEECRQAGIRVIMITGDNKLTAEAICREIGIFTKLENISDRSFTGKEWEIQDPFKQQQILANASLGLVFSRAEPRHKQEIVRVLRNLGEVVAMTGDGVNDAPALKLADIGIAMGIAGTEVAKEASDMVLADDNFSTIVSAVAEGRSIYNNMKAFIRYMISSNIGEVASIFLTAALGMPENLIPVQLLWVNLVTDGPPATALGFNPPELDVMQRPPRNAEDKLISPWVFFRYLVIGTYVGIATVGVFAAWYTTSSFLGIDLSSDGHTPITLSELTHWDSCHTWKDFEPTPFTAGWQRFSFDSDPCSYFSTGKIKAATLSLSVLVAIEMFNALNALSEDGSLLSMPPWVNPWLLVAMCVSFGLHFLIMYVPFFARVFSIVPLSFNEWLLVLLFAAPVVLIDEVLKFIGRHSTSRHLKKRLRKKTA